MKKIFFVISFASITSLGFCQKVNLNLFFGASNYEGDLQSNFFTFTQPGLTIGGGLSYQLSDRVFIRAGLTSAKVSADDKNNSKLSFRNLNFKSSIKELHLAGEFYIFNTENINILPYIFGGIAVYRFNPYTKDTAGIVYFLQPLSTEGQGFFEDRKPYSLTQFAIPFGGGIKYVLNENLKIGVEVGMRKLFTDYLDDVSKTYVDPNLLVSNRGAKALELAFRRGEIDDAALYPTAQPQRGEPKNKDWFYFTGITLSYRLPGSGGINDGRRSGKKNNHLGCPRF